MKIILEKGQRLFFVSDSHFSHGNICRPISNWGKTDADGVFHVDMRSTRDFKSLDHMNDTIVNNINSMVGENDILFHLGDWSFGGFENIQEFRSRILCKNVHLILGNHDHHIERDKGGVKDLFASVNHYAVLDIRKQEKDETKKYSFVVCHFPIASWDNMSAGKMHLHGHVHLSADKKIAEGRAMDVGMDGNNMMPYSMEEVISLLKSRPVKRLTLPSDHHETGER